VVWRGTRFVGLVRGPVIPSHPAGIGRGAQAPALKRRGVARNGRIVRILKIARALAASRRGVSLKDLAAREGWPWRTVYRDRDALDEAGFPIEEVSHGRYRMSEGWAAPNLPDIRPEEVAAFFALRALAQTWRGTDLGQPLDDLWAKLTAGSTRQAALVPRAAEPWMSVRSPIGIDYRAHVKTIAVFKRAIAERLVVNTRYRALSTGETSAREIEPGDLHWDPALETLYLIGWCRLRSDVRVFAVHRFQAVALTEETFAPRPHARSKAALKDAFRVWRGGHVETVRLRFGRQAAEEIRERRWHIGQHVEEVADGGLVLKLEVASSGEVQRWILGFGPDVEVLAPAGLRERVESRLADAAARYRDAPASSQKKPAHRAKKRQGSQEMGTPFVRKVSPGDNRRG